MNTLQVIFEWQTKESRDAGKEAAKYISKVRKNKVHWSEYLPIIGPLHPKRIKRFEDSDKAVRNIERGMKSVGHKNPELGSEIAFSNATEERVPEHEYRSLKSDDSENDSIKKPVSRDRIRSAVKAMEERRKKKEYENLNPIKKLFTKKPDTSNYDSRLRSARKQGPNLPK